jgi:hypothetical protein
MDRLGHSVLHVAQTMAELDAAGGALINEQQGVAAPAGSGEGRTISIVARLLFATLAFRNE